MKSVRHCLVLIVGFAAAFPQVGLTQTNELAPVVGKSVSRTIDLPGEIQPYLSVDLRSRVTGYVEKVVVDRGSVVKQGDVLIELSAPELKAQIVEAESKVLVSESERPQAQAKLASLEASLLSLQANQASLQSTYDRLRSASQTPGAISGNELDVALRSVEAQRANVDAQRASIEAQRAGIESLRNQTVLAQAAVGVLKQMEAYLHVTAPFDGVITERLVHPGAIVGPGIPNALLVLEQVARLRLVVAVPEASVGGIAKGATVQFQVPAYAERIYSGTIARLAQSLDAKSRTMSVEVDVNNKDGVLAPGMFSTVKWPVRSTQASLYVPKTSVVTTTERTFVIREKAGHAEWVDVKKGAADGDLVQVIGNLQAGDRVVKRATDELRDGALLPLPTTK